MNMNQNYKDPARPIKERAESLLEQMTLEEKLAQMGCVMAAMGFFVGDKEEMLKDGIGQISLLSGSFTKQMNVDIVNTTQKFLTENTRLGIPAMFHVETLSGAQSAGATTYPIPVGLASSFDPPMIEKMTANIREEMNALRMKLAFAPVMDVARDPRWGRTCETYGENPTLCSAMSVAYVKGLQGDDLLEGVAATAKHFVGYAMGEGGMNIAGAHIGPRELREIYAKPFDAAIHLAKLEAVMNAYHVIDGMPIAGSRRIFYDMLRGELGFEGLTVSDYGSIEKLHDVYHVAADNTEAGIMALQAGMEAETPGRVCFNDGLRQAVQDGRVDIKIIDNAVRKTLSLKLRLGLFENPYADLEKVNAVFQNPKALDDTHKLACESMVLLKNEGNLLPLDTQKYKKIVVIGPNADTLRVMFGGYSVAGVHEMLLLNMTGSGGGAEGVAMSEEAKARAQGMISRLPSMDQVMSGYTEIQTVADAIKKAFANTEITIAQGCEILGTDKSGFDAAVKAASESELAILVVGGKNGSGAGCSMGENVDSTSVGLPGVQEDLIQSVQAVQKNIIVIHMDGRPLSSVWTAENVPAIIETWHPGQCGAAAIADVLTGKYNPGGKLPITAVRDAGQIPIYADQLRGSGMTGRGLSNSPIQSGYIDQTGSPLYPFGHGLSYTDFALDCMEITAPDVAPGGEVEVFVDVTNIGGRFGEEVVQLYYTDTEASMVRPAQDLAGFIRVPLAPGERKRIRFAMQASQFAFLDNDMNWKVEKGEIEMKIGFSSTDIRLTSRFFINDDAYLPTSERGYYAHASVVN